MALLPPSTNADYRSATVSAWFLVFLGVLSVAPGIIHYFLPDGGAGVIAGIDLSTRRETIVAIFAWFGALQIPYGLGLMIIGLRYRPLTSLLLALVIVERGLMAIDGWFLKGSHGDHHPPEHYASVATVVLGLVFLALSLREKAPARAPA